MSDKIRELWEYATDENVSEDEQKEVEEGAVNFMNSLGNIDKTNKIAATFFYTGACLAMQSKDHYEYNQLLAERNELKAKLSEAVEFAEEIKHWADSYPEKCFKEPEPEQVKEICHQLGITIDLISAMVLRRFTKAWGDKASLFISKHKCNKCLCNNTAECKAENCREEE